MDRGVCFDEVESTLGGRWWSYTACRVPPTTPQAGGAEETIHVPGLDLDLVLGLVRDLGQGLVRTLVQGLGPVLVPTPSTPIESPTAVTYCPDQCTPQGCTSSTSSTSSLCLPPTCSMEGVEHQVGHSWTVHTNPGIGPRSRMEAGGEAEEVCGQVCTCRAEFVSEDPRRVGGVVECTGAPCEPHHQPPPRPEPLSRSLGRRHSGGKGVNILGLTLSEQNI